MTTAEVKEEWRPDSRLAPSSVPSSLLKRGSPGEITGESCPKCPESTSVGDSRCTFHPTFKFKFGKDKSKSAPSSSCPDCGCQKCPDKKLYDRSVNDYCSAKTSGACNSAEMYGVCLFTCPSDMRCEYLNWNSDGLKCGCGCQRCPDGKVYGSTTDYLQTKSLSDDELTRCPHVKFPFVEPVDLCNKKQ